MYARVTTWEGGDAEAIRQMAQRINDDPSGPPEGVPAKRFLMLMDADAGKSVGIVFFETEEDMRKGHETLSGMDPQDDVGTRASVGLYEVGIDVGAP